MVLIYSLSLGICVWDITWLTQVFTLWRLIIGIGDGSVHKWTGTGPTPDLGIEEKLTWPWKHQTNRPLLDARLNWSLLMTEVSDKKEAKRGITGMRSSKEEEENRCTEQSVPHLSIAECDGSRFVECRLKCKGSIWLFSWESDPLPLDHKHFTWTRGMWNRGQTRHPTIWETNAQTSYHHLGTARWNLWRSWGQN